MKITTDKGLFRKTEEYDYKPSMAELYFWYSGTHAGLNRNNPYRQRYGMEVTKVRYTPVSGMVVKSQEASNGVQ